MSIEYLRPIWIEARYFGATRFCPDDSYREFIDGKICCKEIVSFDCCLMDMYEMESAESPLRPETEQIVAVIFRPNIDPLDRLEREGFELCGYDLVDESTSISAITNCGGMFASIPYDKLTEFGLLPTYKDAALAQLALVEEDPDECHAYCIICELWRKLV